MTAIYIAEILPLEKFFQTSFNLKAPEFLLMLVPFNCALAFTPLRSGHIVTIFERRKRPERVHFVIFGNDESHSM